MKREINKKPIVPILTNKTINYLTQLCFKYETIKNTDGVFIFGTNILQKKAANHIENILYHSQAKKCIITGGIANYHESKYESIPESVTIYKNIDTEKFKNVDFYLEQKSKNNLENVNNAIKIIDFTSLESIICISHSYASNRSVQTLRNVFSKKIYSCPYDIYGENKILVDKSAWSKNEEGKAIVWGEYLRIKTYGERGDFPLTKKMKNLIIKIEKEILVTKNLLNNKF